MAIPNVTDYPFNAERGANCSTHFPQFKRFDWEALRKACLEAKDDEYFLKHYADAPEQLKLFDSLLKMTDKRAVAEALHNFKPAGSLWVSQGDMYWNKRNTDLLVEVPCCR